MESLRFEWDSKKSLLNRRKHGISFEEARTVFYDENARLLEDPSHSQKEERFVILGLSAQLRMVVVCHCYRKQSEVVRIISARKATKHEASIYWSML